MRKESVTSEEKPVEQSFGAVQQAVPAGGIPLFMSVVTPTEAQRAFLQAHHQEIAQAPVGEKFVMTNPDGSKTTFKKW